MRNWGSWDPRRDRKTAIVFASDTVLKSFLHNRCAILERWLRQTPPADIALKDLDFRDLHHRLYTALVPDLPESVATFRGTPNSPVEFAERVVKVEVVLDGMQEYDRCFAPDDVLPAMTAFQTDFEAAFSNAHSGTFSGIYAELTHRFMKIHPFLDGNGHVWRAILIAGARKAGLRVKDTWTIDPRSYGPEISYAIQVFSKSKKPLEDFLKQNLID